jgi:CBS domain containing-hemolysin-like protein
MDDSSGSYFIFAFFQLVGAEFPAVGQTILELAAMFFIVLLNGFFVASEFALVSARKSRLEARAEKGSAGAKAALRLLQNPTFFISTVQLGVTLASLALGWIGEPTIAKILEPAAAQFPVEGATATYLTHFTAIVVSFGLVTFLHIVLGELFPKMFALERAESFAIVAARPIEFMGRTFAPVLWIFNQAGIGLARLFGLKASLAETSVYNEDEIRQIINLSYKSGHVNEEEQRLINSVFEFSETTVKEAMIPRTQIAAVSHDCSLREICEAFAKNGYSRLPVYREDLDDVLGFVHGKDVMQYLLKPDKFKIEDVLQPPLYIVDNARLEDVLRTMQRAKTHFGFVVDEHGGVEGIITLEDLLEEIVGEISDEHDEEVNEQITDLGDGKFLLDGSVAVRDLNRRLNLQIPENESYTTLAGFLMAQTGQVLQTGERVNYNNHVFHIEKVDRRRISKVRMESAADNQYSAAVSRQSA